MPDDTHGPGSPPNGRRANGSPRPAPLFTRRILDGDVQAPIDLVAIQADDELVNALGARPAAPSAGAFPRHPARDAVGGIAGEAGGPPPGAGNLAGRGDDRLVAMLAAWRAEIDAEPIPELVDLDAAVAAVNAGIAQHQASTARRRRAGRLRQLAPLVAAAAIIVATMTGVGLGSQNAMPGDTLWPIQKVVNPERAESVEAKVKVESRLETVRAALKTGDTATAAKELEAIRTEIPVVRGQEGQPQLVQEQDFLAAKLADTPPGQPADLSTPPKSNPAARPTGTPVAPPPPPADSQTLEPSVSPSASHSKSTEPDVRKSTPDQSSEAVEPPPPVRTEPGAPGPVQPAPEVTTDPQAPQPKPQPSPPGETEGTPDPTVAPGPVEQPPASGTDSGVSSGGGVASDTTAAGAAGADVQTTATDSTS